MGLKKLWRRLGIAFKGAKVMEGLAHCIESFQINKITQAAAYSLFPRKYGIRLIKTEKS